MSGLERLERVERHQQQQHNSANAEPGTATNENVPHINKPVNTEELLVQQKNIALDFPRRVPLSPLSVSGRWKRVYARLGNKTKSSTGNWKLTHSPEIAKKKYRFQPIVKPGDTISRAVVVAHNRKMMEEADAYHYCEGLRVSCATIPSSYET
jgi:hypothetical protein